MAKKKHQSAPFGNRVVGHGTAPAGSFLANEENWRIHPAPQQSALDSVLNAVGFVQTVIVNRRTSKAWGDRRGVETMVDGHLRVQLALSRGEDTEVPYVAVDLEPEEERLVLATLDPLAALAASDDKKLSALVDGIRADWPDAGVDLDAILKRDRRSLRELVSFEAKRGENQFVVIVECRDERHQTELLERLLSEGLTCRAMLA